MSPSDNSKHLTPFTSENAAEMARRSHAARKQKKLDAAALLAEAGYFVPEDAPPALQKLAESAAGGNASDMRLWLQQSGLMKKQEENYTGDGPCPTCGLDPTEGLMLMGEDLEELKKNLALLEELIAETEERQAALRDE